MKKAAFFLISSSLLPIASVISYAEGEDGVSLFSKIGSNIWYILLVVAFGGGLLLISKWSQRINEWDRQLEEERLAYEREHPAQEESDAPQDEESDEPSEKEEQDREETENDQTK